MSRVIDFAALAQEASSFNLAEWPSLSYQGRGHLPQLPGLYCLWRDGRVLYIGEAQNLRLRWHGHKHRDVSRGCSLRYYLLDGDRQQRRFIEWVLIVIHQPPLNATKNRQIWRGASQALRIQKNEHGISLTECNEQLRSQRQNKLNKPKVISSAAVALIAHDLKITESRVRQIIGQLKLKPVDKIGNVPFYSEAQILLIRNRNKKPGPKGGKTK